VIENGRYHFTEDCDRVAELLRRVGDKWSVLIVVLLELGPRRFNDLKRSIPGISQRMLTLTLRGLRHATGTTLTVVGEIQALEAGVTFRDAAGRPVTVASGYEHFRG